MQCDTDGIMSIDQEDDQDSLFGSPPPSPVRGRSPSPALALPCRSTSVQNVGTIALPGSHHYSELPVTPLALSLSYALTEFPQRPPASSTTTIPSNAATIASSSRASSTAPSLRPKKKTSKNIKSKEPTPRPPPPEIPLPDPSAPVPANFLRNQSALLGTAGLVGGVKPANLSTNRHSRGTNASNPIVIDDEERRPTLRRPSAFRPHPQSNYVDIDAYLLPTPSTQEVVAVLIGQKDIFPILESILKLIASGNGPQALNPSTPAPLTSFRRTPQSFQPSGSIQQTPGTFQPFSSTSTSSGPPPKKRRLSRVPAGAVDWDVPYPFPEGQGPESYRTTWERERGKQLISQLVTVIKSAARKAATKKYIQNEQTKRQLFDSLRTSAWFQAEHQAEHRQLREGPKVHGHYRPSTVTYGLQGEAAAAARAQVQEVLTDASNGSKKPVLPTAAASSPYQPVHQGARAMSPQPPTPFDQLISSLLAATPDQKSDSSSDNAMSLSNTTGASAGAPGAPLALSCHSQTEAMNVDQNLFDNWMNVLHSFPMLAPDFSSPAHNIWGLPTHSDASTPSSANDDFGFLDFDSNLVNAASYDFNGIFDSDVSTTPTTDSLGAQPSSSASQNNIGSSSQDIAIDPALLAISLPPSGASTSMTVDIPPSLTGSPMPSLSSLGDGDPSTPNSATWDLSLAEVFMGSGRETSSDIGLGGHEYRVGGLAGQGMWGYALRNLLRHAHDIPQDGSEEYMNDLAVRVDKGKGRELNDSMGQSPLLPTAAQSETYEVSLSSSGLPQKPPGITDVRLHKGLQNKADILRRAAERKRQLVTELDIVRTQLWETTIEQGVLSHMIKLCSHTT